MDEMQWVRPPKQERSQKTLDAFLNAVEGLLEEQGVETISVKEIAERAGLSVGGFYARFPNKEAVLRALHLRFAVEAKATADVALDPKRWKGVHMVDAIPRLVAFLADDYRRRPGLRRAFLLLNGTDAEIKTRSQEVSGYTAGRFHGFFADKAAELDHDDLMLASDMLHRMLFSVLDNFALFKDGSSTGRTINHDVFVAELTRLVMGYLRVKPKPLDMPAFDPMTLPVIGATLSSLSGSAAEATTLTTLKQRSSSKSTPAPSPSSRPPVGDVVTVPVKDPKSGDW